MDPTGANTILQHEFQGTTSLNLIGGSRRDTSYPNADSFLITNTNVSIHIIASLYLCKLVDM